MHISHVPVFIGHPTRDVGSMGRTVNLSVTVALILGVPPSALVLC